MFIMISKLVIQSYPANSTEAVLITRLNNQNCCYEFIKRQIQTRNVSVLNDKFELSHVRVIACPMYVYANSDGSCYFSFEFVQ